MDDIFQRELNGELIRTNEPEYEKIIGTIWKTMKLASKLNTSLLDVEENRKILVQIFGKEYDESTIAARKKLNGNQNLFILCKVYDDLSAEDEALLFSQQTGVSSKPTPGITLRARNIGNDKESLEFVKANLSVGISPSYSLVRGTCRLRCINTAKNEYLRIGSDKYKEAMSIIVEAWKGHPKALIGSVVVAMCSFVNTYHGEYDRRWLVRKLSYTNPYDIVIQARSLGDDGGLKSAIKHILDIYNYNNINPLPVNF